MKTCQSMNLLDQSGQMVNPRSTKTKERQMMMSHLAKWSSLMMIRTKKVKKISLAQMRIKLMTTPAESCTKEGERACKLLAMAISLRTNISRTKSTLFSTSEVSSLSTSTSSSLERSWSAPATRAFSWRRVLSTIWALKSSQTRITLQTLALRSLDRQNYSKSAGMIIKRV